MTHGRVADVGAAMQALLREGHSRADSRFAHAAGEVLHWLEEGTGAPVVLLHGGTGGGANWFRLLPRLAATHRVLAPDLPGFGLSPHRHPVAPLGTAAAELLDEWLRGLGVADAVVAGTSFGGLAALRLAQCSPDLVGRLLLLDAAGLGRELHPLVRLATLPVLDRVAAHPTRAGTARVFRTLLTRDRSRMPKSMQTALVDYLYASARAAGPSYLRRTLRLFAGPRGQREYLTGEELAGLPQPVALVVGERDPFFPPAQIRRVAAVMTRAHLTVVPGAGHSPNWEAPDAVYDALRLLTDA